MKRITIRYWAFLMCHYLFKMTTVLDIQFRFLPLINVWVDHLCVMLRVVVQKISLSFSLLLCYFNRSAKIKFTHRALQTFVCKPQPHLSMLQGDLEGIMWDEVLSMVWTISLMQVLLDYLICFKPLRRLPFILFVISDFNYSRKRS